MGHSARPIYMRRVVRRVVRARVRRLRSALSSDLQSQEAEEVGERNEGRAVGWIPGAAPRHRRSGAYGTIDPEGAGVGVRQIASILVE